MCVEMAWARRGVTDVVNRYHAVVCDPLKQLRRPDNCNKQAATPLRALPA